MMSRLLIFCDIGVMLQISEHDSFVAMLDLQDDFHQGDDIS